MIDSALENSCATLAFVTEVSENEEFPQPGGLDLVPAYGFEIARGHSDKLPRSLQRFKEPDNTRADLRHNLPVIDFYFAANNFKRFWKGCFKMFSLNSRAFQRRPQ